MLLAILFVGASLVKILCSANNVYLSSTTRLRFVLRIMCGLCVCVCVYSYNVEDDQVNCFIRIPMEKVKKIVIGEQCFTGSYILVLKLAPY